jgi:hypothetical protein
MNQDQRGVFYMMRVQRCLRQIAPVILLMAAFHLGAIHASADDEDFKWDDSAPACAQTSQVGLRGCEYSAKGAYRLALGSCHNLSGAREKGDCLTNAEGNLTSQLNECNEQFKARNQVCKEVGEGAYDPEVARQGFIKHLKNLTGNLYFPLTPGLFLTYKRVAPDGNDTNQRVLFDITNQQKKILGVTCRAVWNVTRTTEGELKDSTLRWYAQDKDGNVWNFGEISQQFEEGLLAGGEGFWNAGVNRAMPGVAMLVDPKNHPAKAFRQQFYLGKFENVSRIVGMLDKLPALKKKTSLPPAVHGPYLHTQQFSPLDPGSLSKPVNKFYAPGVGLVLTITPDGSQEVLVGIEKRLAGIY